MENEATAFGPTLAVTTSFLRSRLWCSSYSKPSSVSTNVRLGIPRKKGFGSHHIDWWRSEEQILSLIWQYLFVFQMGWGGARFLRRIMDASTVDRVHYSVGVDPTYRRIWASCFAQYHIYQNTSFPVIFISEPFNRSITFCGGTAAARTGVNYPLKPR